MKKLIILICFCASAAFGQGVKMIGVNTNNGAAFPASVFNTNAPSDNQIMKFDSGTGKWQPEADAGGAPEGYIKGMYCDYLNTTQVTWSVGSAEHSGTAIEISTAFTTTVSTLAAGADWHYAYVTNSASGTLSASDIVWSTTEPTESSTLHGWYDAQNNRCIGAVYSSAAGATIYEFDRMNDGMMRYQTILIAASSMNPAGTWQTPDDAETSTLCSVLAKRMRVHIRFGESTAGDHGYGSVANKESVDAGTANADSLLYFDPQAGDAPLNLCLYTATVNLGTSRNLRVHGADNDDNELGLSVVGFWVRR
jgi:hypothetical protein